MGLVCDPDSLEGIKSVFIEAIEMSYEKSKKYIKRHDRNREYENDIANTWQLVDIN